MGNFWILLSDLLAVILATLFAGKLATFGFPLSDPARRIGCIDGLRGYLALAVMVTHMHLWTGILRFGGTWAEPRVNALNLGGPGVALFFMTTGLVFYPRVMSGFTNSNWLAVLITRIFRLMPLIMLAVSVVVAMISFRQGTVPSTDDVLPIAIWISTVNTPPIMKYDESWKAIAGVLWTLKLEWLFYLGMLPISAIVYQIFKRFQISGWLLPFLILVSCTILLVLGPAFPSGTLVWFARFIALFACGMLAYEIRMQEKIAAYLAKPVMSLPAVLCAILGVGLWGDWAVFNLASMAFLFGFFLCVACGNSLWGILKYRGALVLGECSYGIYLCHGIILFLAFDIFNIGELPLQGPAFSILILPLMLILVGFTAVTFLLVERPSIKFGKHLAKVATSHAPVFRRREPQIPA